MLTLIHFYPTQTSIPVMDRIAALLVICYSVERGWALEHFDIKSAFLHEIYKHQKPVNIKEMPRADGIYKNGNTIAVLELNLYGNPTGKYY